MTALFKKLDAASKGIGEHRDCTVKAWAVACDLPYEKAYADLAAVGRKPRHGVYMENCLAKLCEMREKRFTDVTEEFKRKGAKTMTTVPRVLPKRGAFLVFVRGHVAAYRGGELHDWSKGRRHRVIKIYRINSLPKKRKEDVMAYDDRPGATSSWRNPRWKFPPLERTPLREFTPGGGVVNWRNIKSA